MAQKRMFSLAVVDTDRFLDMPSSAQSLYFHLGMHGDDDGFVASPLRIMRSCGSAPDDLKLLVAKGFIYTFDSGVCVILDWKVNNTLKNDRYAPTLYQAEFQQIAAMVPERFQLGSSLVPQHNRTKQNITKQSRGKSGKESKPSFSPPSVEEVQRYCRERGNRVDAERFVDYYAAIGWRVGKNPMRDWRACVRTWERKDEAQQTAAPQTSATDAIKARREREQAATVRADDLVEFPAGSGNYRLRSEVTAWTK